MNKKITKIKEQLNVRNINVDFLAILFGVGAWLGVNSIFVQLPLLVETAPEGWSLPSYIVVSIQIANIGPLMYTLYQKYSPKKVKDSYFIYFVYSIGCITAILTSFLYQSTAIIAGKERSLAMLIFSFLLAFVGCTSSVLFMPYMGRFKEMYLITYLIGEGLSGLLSGIVALIQGVGGNPECILVNSTHNGDDYVKHVPPPRFGVQEFFIYVFVTMTISALAFLLLDKLKMCKKEYASVTISYGHDYMYNDPDKLDEDYDRRKDVENKAENLSTLDYVFLLALMCILCFLANGVFPSIQSYSCLPYGNITYHLSVTFLSLANPIACFLAVFLNHTSIKNICLLTIPIAITSAYGLATSVLSPTPPMVDHIIGKILVVLCWTLNMGLISYAKLSITAILRNRGGRSLVWVGSVTQIGSAAGAVVSFLLINNTNIFVSYEPC